MELCAEQVEGGPFFIHEHPKGVGSWEEECAEKISKLEGVHAAPAVERIEDLAPSLVFQSDQHPHREVDRAARPPEKPAHLEVDDAEADRRTAAVVDDTQQVRAVHGPVLAVVGAAISIAAGHHLPQRFGTDVNARAVFGLARVGVHVAGDPLEVTPVGLDRRPRPEPPAEREGRLGEVNVRVGGRTEP